MKGHLPKLAVVIALLMGGALFYLIQQNRTNHLVLQPRQITLPADGRFHIAFHIKPTRSSEISVAQIRSSVDNLRLIQKSATEVEGQVRAPVMPQDQTIRLVFRKQSIGLHAQFVPDYTDSYGDGTPDFLRLHTEEDRRAFRAWFSAIAELQAEKPKDELPPEIEDCAALLRYAYRETLHAHNEDWLADQHLETLGGLPSVQQYKYPQTPLGASLFRVKPGRFLPEDLSNGSFSQFADAKNLMLLNTHFISRDIHVAQTGDLIFFRQLEQNSPYHSMVVTDNHADWVVYHTGPIGKAKGEMRRVSIEDLLHHPDARWRPVPENSNFLGVYRWNILRDGE